jgi:HTH-type transcriptional regulator, sugar sensing transcriptional regulator
VAAKPQRLRAGPQPVISAFTLESLGRAFEEFGLSPYEARVLLGVLRLGSAGAVELAQASRVPRTSVYPALESLTEKRLVHRIPGPGPASWGSPGREAVVRQLLVSEEERRWQRQAHADRLHELLVKTFPENPATFLPFVQVISDPAQGASLFQRLQSEARSEILMFNRAPYAVGGSANVSKYTSLAKGVRHRDLYEISALEGPGGAACRRYIEGCLKGGEKLRLVDGLPVKLAVFDRHIVLLGLDDPSHPEGYPTTLLFEHPGFAESQANTFERYWARGRPYSKLSAQPRLTEASARWRARERPTRPDATEHSARRSAEQGRTARPSEETRQARGQGRALN